MIIRYAPEHPETVGEECTIVRLDVNINTGKSRYVTDLMAPSGNPYAGWDENFRPVYDGDEPVRWEECLWQPKELSK